MNTVQNQKYRSAMKSFSSVLMELVSLLTVIIRTLWLAHAFSELIDLFIFYSGVKYVFLCTGSSVEVAKSLPPTPENIFFYCMSAALLSAHNV